ncbi:hypothetical protein H6F74_26955 [Trichocoleus sp. FACHB-90]|nr:hypothetical protein [Trichocoleus sp. FACHB-90]
MSGKFGISFLVLVSMTLMGACSDIREKYPRSAINPSLGLDINNTPTPGLQSPTTQVSQSIPVSAEAERKKYKTIPLTNIKDAKSLKGSDPQAIALAAFGNIESEGGSRDVRVEYPQPDRAVVTIAQTGVADDSVGAIKYRVEFAPTSPSAQKPQEWTIAWVGSQVKCHVGRGHQDWSTEICQ